MTLKSQYDMLANQASVDTKQEDYSEAINKYYNKSNRLTKSMQTVRTQSKQISNPENFAKLKKFMEDDQVRCCKLIDRATAREQKMTTDQVKAQREKAIAKNKKLVACDALVWLSDEMSNDEDESTGSNASTAANKPSVETPGNAQSLETPSVVKPVDFKGITSE